jgi:hypothetical protein
MDQLNKKSANQEAMKNYENDGQNKTANISAIRSNQIEFMKKITYKLDNS